MAIEKSPLRMFSGPEEDIELEIDETAQISPEDLEVFLQEDGSAVIGDDPNATEEVPFGENLSDVISENELRTLASELTSSYEEDLESRSDWFTTFSNGLDLLGIKQEDRSQPFVGSSGVYHPILAEAVTQFQAQAYKELLPAGGPVDTEILGMTSDDKLEKANRVKNFMNYQITYNYSFQGFIETSKCDRLQEIQTPLT